MIYHEGIYFLAAQGGKDGRRAGPKGGPGDFKPFSSRSQTAQRSVQTWVRCDPAARNDPCPAKGPRSVSL